MRSAMFGCARRGTRPRLCSGHCRMTRSGSCCGAKTRRIRQQHETDRPYADPEITARKIVELANEFEPTQEGRIYIEKINGPFLFQLKGSPAEYKAGLDRAIANGWLVLHESGTFVKCNQAGASTTSSRACERVAARTCD